MIALLQRVLRAQVDVDDVTIGVIGAGLLVFVCAERDDVPAQCDALLAKVLRYRIFDDGQGRMNRSLRDVAGGLLLVPQFTLAADTHSGTRPSFTPAAAPGLARELFERLVRVARAAHDPVATGSFGAHMQVALVNDGPVTFWLRTPMGMPAAPGRATLS